MLTKKHYLILMFLCAVFLPQLPPVFGRSELHINIIAVFLSLCGLFFWGRINLNKAVTIAIYFSICQFLLFLSYLFGVEGLSSLNELPSLLRPAMLFVVALLFVVLLDESGSFETCMSLATVISVVSFGYAVLEVFFFSLASPAMHLFYRLSDKANIDGVSVSFFTLPYYAAYVHSIMLLFVLCAWTYKKTLFSFLVVLMALLNIVLTQSKTGVFVALITIFLYWFLSAGKGARWVVAVLAISSAALLLYFLYDLVKYLDETVGGNFAYTTLLILERPEEAGNLAERTRQIGDTLQVLSSNNWLIGIGLGKGATIESWLAYIPYRYGGLGFIFFIAFYLFVAIRSIHLSYSLPVLYDRLAARIVGVWSVCLFSSQLSSLSMEMSKASIFTALMMGLASNLILRRSN